MFRKPRAPSTPTSPTSPSTGQEGNNEISDDYEVVQTPSGSNPNSLPSSDAPVHRRPSHPSPTTPGVTPPPHIRQASSRDDWYPSWLPRRPPPPAPASTVPSERGHANSPVPYISSSNAGTARGGRPMATGAHRMTPSYDTERTGYTGYTGTGESGEYVDIGDYDLDPALAESEGTEERVGIGRRQTPRSVRIISEATAAASSRRQTSSRHSRRPSSGVPQVRSRKEGRAGHVHGTGPKPWWRGTVSTPLSPTVVSPSPFPGALGPTTTDVPPPSAPPHMRAYLPHPGMPGVGGYGTVGSVALRPRFRAPGLDLGFLSNPSVLMRLRYILWPIWIYGLVVLQSFFDLNAIYCLVQLALHPTPASPPSSASNNSNPSSSRNWALGAAGYGICWLFWIVGIVLIYEIVYCWWRRWRCKRPLMIPLYLSAPAYNIVCMTSFVNFCFFRYIRSSARPRLPIPRFLRPCGSSSSGSTIPSRAVTPSAMSVATEARASQQQDREAFSPTTAEGKENIPIIPSASIRTPALESMSSLASWGDWFGETCYFYGQNLPTVALLLPRVALCVAILLASSSAQPEDKALEALGLMKRDQTFFRADGSLSGYARGVLLANVAWTTWRVLILLISWIGLWWMSGQMCAGVCGPRFRWEEPEERPGFAKGLDEEQFEEAQGVLATWTWRECTRARVYDAYDLCLFLPPPSSKAAEKGRDVSAEKPDRRLGGGVDEEEEDAVLDRVLAAAGLPKAPPPARRGVLRDELFDTPPEIRRELSEEGGVQEIIIGSPKPATRQGSSRSRSSRERPPSIMKPYPFTTYPARQGSQDTGTPSQEKIPFPPSPRTSKHSDMEGAGHEAEVEDDGEEEEDFNGEEGYDEFGLSIEEPSSGRNSASMSSLGQQIPSRFPFQFRHISRRSRGGRSSVGTQQSRSNSNKTSSASYGASHASRTVSSSDRRQSQVSDSPWSQSQSQRSPIVSTAQSPVSPHEGATSSSSYGSPISGGHLGSQNPIPMPPRASHKTRRQRASLPALPVSAIPTGYSGVRDRSRTLSGGTQASSGLNLSPHPQCESSGGEEEEHERGTSREFGMLTDPEADGSQEEAEREDSVGLLSGGPSPRSSLGMLRSRSNLSLTNVNLGIPHSRRSRHSSASSVSHSRSSRGSRSVSLTGSGSQGASARSRSISTQARSRAQSLIQGFGPPSQSNVNIEMGMRSRTSSLARLSEVPSVHRRSGESQTESLSGTSNAVSVSQHRTNPEDYTFGQPIRLRDDSGSEGSGKRGQESLRERSPPSRRLSRQEAVVPEREAEPTRTVRESQSQASGLAPSEQSQQTMQQPAVVPTAPASSALPIPTTGSRPLHGGQSFISSAHDSLITHPTSQEGSSDTASNAPSSFGTTSTTHEPEHLHGHQGSGWRPA